MKKMPARSIFATVSQHFLAILIVIISLLILVLAGLFIRDFYHERIYMRETQSQLEKDRVYLRSQLDSTTATVASVSAELASLQAEDQVIKNKSLEEEIKNIQKTFQQAVIEYEEILDIRGGGGKVQTVEASYSLVLSQLSKRQYEEATKTLVKLQNDLLSLKAQLVASGGAIPADLKNSNIPPGAGYSKQVVESDAGQFIVDILAADLNSTRVQVETASAADCGDNCAVGALSDFISRSGGYAGINGSYFCPAEYPSCAGKTNSFDTLLMNKNKFYFNSDNNVYSVVPALIFSGNSARIVKSAEAGRDGGVDAVIASQPALVWGGEVVFGGDGDPKKGSRGSRSFIAVKDSKVYIGIVRGATVAEVARVMKALGMQSALNLDSGGSTAFFVNGKYVAGPGRQTPFGIVLVRK